MFTSERGIVSCTPMRTPGQSASSPVISPSCLSFIADTSVIVRSVYHDEVDRLTVKQAGSVHRGLLQCLDQIPNPASLHVFAKARKRRSTLCRKVVGYPR